jgi:hypothetical protein
MPCPDVVDILCVDDVGKEDLVLACTGTKTVRIWSMRWQPALAQVSAPSLVVFPWGIISSMFDPDRETSDTALRPHRKHTFRRIVYFLNFGCSNPCAADLLNEILGGQALDEFVVVFDPPVPSMSYMYMKSEVVDSFLQVLTRAIWEACCNDHHVKITFVNASAIPLINPDLPWISSIGSFPAPPSNVADLMSAVWLAFYSRHHADKPFTYPSLEEYEERVGTKQFKLEMVNAY